MAGGGAGAQWREGTTTIGHGGERRGGMVALEHALAMRTRRCSEWRGTDDGLMSGYGCRRVDERIHK
jgi:hypothetical protein